MRAHLSIKGVLRVYGGPLTQGTSMPAGAPQGQDIHNGKFSVSRAIRLSANGVEGMSGEPLSLVSELDQMARTSHHSHVEECVFNWDAGYDQVWTHITLAIELQPHGVSAAMMAALKSKWKKEVEGRWSEEWGCTHAGEVICPITLTIKWVAGGHPVKLMAGGGRADMGTLFEESEGLTAAHECGHMFGLYDEYVDEKCPDRSLIDVESIMGEQHRVRDRHVAAFAARIHSELVVLS